MTAASPALAHGRKLIAPLWHTALYLIILAVQAARGLRYQTALPWGTQSRVAAYLFIIASEWLMVALVAWGMRLGGSSLRVLIGERWTNATSFLRDIGIAVAFVLASNLVLNLIAQALRASNNARVLNLLPHTPSELALWMFVALSAGICEELTTRGYLQLQFGALLRSSTAGIAVQAVIFGVAHVYQGWKHVFTIALLALMMGWLAKWRRSLLPGMTAHFFQDALGGVLRGGH